MEKEKLPPQPTIPLAIKILKKKSNKLPPKNGNSSDAQKDDKPRSFSTYYQSNKHIQDKLKTCNLCNQSVEATIYTTHVDSHPSKIFDWLYIGSYNNATNKKELDLLNIKYIMNCARECNNLFTNDIKYINFKLSDQIDSEISNHFDAAFKFFDEAKNNESKILVHCQLGKSRSVSMVIGYLIKAHKMTYEEAYKFVKSKRKVALPNLGFVRQLRELEKSHFPDFNLYKSHKSSKSYRSHSSAK